MASAAGVSAEDVINAKEVEIEKLEAAIVTNEAKIKEILLSLRTALKIAESGTTKTQRDLAATQSKTLKSTYKTVQQSINISKNHIYELLKQLIMEYKVTKHAPKLRVVLEERKREKDKMTLKSAASSSAAAAAADDVSVEGDDDGGSAAPGPAAEGGKRRKTTTRKQKGRRTTKKQNKNKKSRKH
jgi:hypothetical protein